MRSARFIAARRWHGLRSSRSQCGSRLAPRRSGHWNLILALLDKAISAIQKLPEAEQELTGGFHTEYSGPATLEGLDANFELPAFGFKIELSALYRGTPLARPA